VYNDCGWPASTKVVSQESGWLEFSARKAPLLRDYVHPSSAIFTGEVVLTDKLDMKLEHATQDLLGLAGFIIVEDRIIFNAKL